MHLRYRVKMEGDMKVVEELGGPVMKNAPQHGEGCVTKHVYYTTPPYGSYIHPPKRTGHLSSYRAVTYLPRNGAVGFAPR